MKLGWIWLSALYLEDPALAQDAPIAPEQQLPPLVRGPELVTFVEAPRPEAPFEGEVRVLLLLEIDDQGAVSRVEVLRGFGSPFDEAAAEAARSFVFTPAEDAQGPVPVAVEFEYVFPALPAEPALLKPPEEPAPVVLRGRLQEMLTRAPLAGAAIVVQDQDGQVLYETVTEADGNFALRGLPPGEYRLLARRPGHAEVRKDVRIEEVLPAEPLVLWARSLVADNEVLVIYERDRPPEATRRTLSISEVRRVPGTFGDPVRVIQSLPGAARAPFATGLLVLRGANPDDSNVYVDGVEVPLVYHLGGVRSVLNADLIETVDYLPGGYGVRYGRSLGGVVDVRTQESWPERDRATVRADVLDVGGYIEGRQGKLGYAAGVRRSYVDAVLGIVLRKQEFSASPRWFDYQLKLAHLGSGPGKASLLLFGFDDQVLVRTDGDTREAGVGYSTHRATLSLSKPLTNTLTFSVQPSAGVVGQSIGLGQAYRFELQAALLDLRAELGWRPGQALGVKLGLDAEASRNDYELYLGNVSVVDDDPLSEKEALDLDNKVEQLTPDPYVEATLQPLPDREALMLVTGLRMPVLIRSRTDRQHAWDPRALLRARLLPGGTLKAGAGIYHQPPSGLSLGRGRQLERAISSEVGWEQQVTGAIRADLTGYHRYIGEPPDEGEEERDSIRRAYGMELMVRHALTNHFFGWVSYTLSKSERNDDPDDPDNEVGWYPFDYDQTHIFTSVAGYQLPWSFGVSARAQYVTGNPYTPFAGAVYLMDRGNWLPYPTGDPNSARQPPYWSLDLRVDKRFTFRHWQLEIFLDLLNTLRGENPEYLLYNYDYTESDYLRGLPFLPSLGFLAEVNF